MTATTTASGDVDDLIAKLKQLKKMANPAPATYSLDRAPDTPEETYILKVTWTQSVTETP